jgi:hypothetical protein
LEFIETSTALLVRALAGSKLLGFAGSSIVMVEGMVPLLEEELVELVDEVGGSEAEEEEDDEELDEEVDVVVEVDFGVAKITIPATKITMIIIATTIIVVEIPRRLLKGFIIYCLSSVFYICVTRVVARKLEKLFFRRKSGNSQT